MKTPKTKIESAPAVDTPAISPAVAPPQPTAPRSARGRFAPKNGTAKTVKPSATVTDKTAADGSFTAMTEFLKGWPGKLLALSVGGWFVYRCFTGDDGEKHRKAPPLKSVSPEEYFGGSP